MTTPSFALNFTTETLDPGVTFARTGSTATVTNASGLLEVVAADTPRFDYDSITLACKGLLIEESRSNLLSYSEDFTDATWALSSFTLTADTATGPFGGLTLDRLTETTAFGSQHWLSKTISATGVHTLSVYVKRTSSRFLTLGLNNSASAYATVTFDVSSTDGSVTQVLQLNYANTSGTITRFGADLFRATITTTPSTTATSVAVGVASTGTFVSGVRGFNAYTGSATKFIEVSCAQLEAGAFATSYIPTTTASVIRNADVATITGTNFSDFWQASKGGAMVQAIPSTVSGIRPLVQYDDGTADNIIALRGNTTNPELYVVDGGAPQAQLDAGTIAANTAYSLTGWWATNDCKARKDSGAVVTDDTATIPTVTLARLGSDGTNYLNGHLATVNYYDTFSGQIYTRRKNKVIFNLM